MIQKAPTIMKDNMKEVKRAEKEKAIAYLIPKRKFL